MDHVAKSYYFRDLFSRKYFLNHCYRSVYYIINNIVNPVGSKLIYIPNISCFNHTHAKIRSVFSSQRRSWSFSVWKHLSRKICHRSTNRRRGGSPMLEILPLDRLPLFIFSSFSSPSLPTPSLKWNTDLVGGPRQLSMSSSSISSPRWRRYFNLARGPRNVGGKGWWWCGAVWGWGNAHG